MSRLNLTDVEWRDFKVNEIFEVVNSKPYHKDTLAVNKIGIPYITRTSQNNGLEEIVFLEDDFIVNPGNTISFGAENADFFYQEVDYLTGNKMYRICNKKINKHIGLFLVQVFRSSIKECGFGYGKGLTGTRFKDRVIMLPVDIYGEPYWQFMEDYIKQEQKVQAQKIIDYYESKMLKTAFDLLGFEDVEWKDYKICELFRFERKPSKGLNHLISKKDGISYLGATNRNNGVLDFVEKKEKLAYEGNAIAFIRNGEGSMGYSIYKKESFIATQDISVGYNENLNKYNAMFITTIADRVRGKYNFGYKRNQQRLEAEILQLPADSDGNPHWDYMSKFMQNIETEKLREALDYICAYIN
jgi:hypothetical protein